MSSNRISVIMSLLIAAGLPLGAVAYEVPVHVNISEKAFAASVLTKQPSVLSNLGLTATLKFPNSANVPKTVETLVKDGAAFEDDFPRSLNHFFDPINDAPLSILGLPLANASPDWALEDRQEIGGAWRPQDFSYRDANLYLYRALTLPNKVDRDKNFGLLFETIGRVIHHIQDMAQPQHVRNDQHADLGLSWGSELLFCLGATQLCATYQTIKNPSAYEKYTLERGNANRLRYDGYAPAYPGPQSPADSISHAFAVPRDFWKVSSGVHAGKGIAEFTNANFVSAGTNFNSEKYAAPALDPTRWKDEDIQVLCQENPPCPTTLSGVMRMYGVDVVDRLIGPPAILNPRATTYSVFDADLTRKGRFPIFTLNRFNYEAAQGLLVPRAVGYSAGLINFFFRGSIDLLADPKDSTAFRIASWGPDPLSGTFALYYDAVDGQRRPVPGASWSLSIAAKPPKATTPSLSAPITFGPPVDAKLPGSYVLVFDGAQGEERPNGSLGAVIGKIASVQHIGGLYVAGLDAQDRMIYVRTDRGGTHVLAGNEFNPFLDAPLPSDEDFRWYESKIYKFKQVRFGTDPNGAPGYAVVALALNDIPDPTVGGWRVNRTITYGPRPPGLTGSGAAWLAESTDPTIGSFIFSVTDPSAPMNYARSWTGADGQSRYATGTIALPQPGSSTAVTWYWGFHDGTLSISPDGRTISGLETESPVATTISGNIETATVMRNWDSVQITLGAAPAAALIEAPYASVVSRTETVPQATFPIGTDSVVAPSGCPLPGEAIRVFTVNETTSSKATHALFTEKKLIGYLNGNLESYEYSEQFDYSDITDRIFDFSGVPVSYGHCCPPTYEWIKTDERGAWITDQKREASWQFGEGSVAAWHYPNRAIHDYTRKFEGCSSDLPPYPPLGGFTEYLEQKVARALTGKAADAITYFRRSPADGYTLQFRGIDITGQLHAADASPLGEVFFALEDLSVVIHEPIAGRMPQIAIPSRMMKVIAALWL